MLSRRIETNKSHTNNCFLDYGGLDTPFATNAQGYASINSAHRSTTVYMTDEIGERAYNLSQTRTPMPKLTIQTLCKEAAIFSASQSKVVPLSRAVGGICHELHEFSRMGKGKFVSIREIRGWFLHLLSTGRLPNPRLPKNLCSASRTGKPSARISNINSEIT